MVSPPYETPTLLLILTQIFIIVVLIIMIIVITMIVFVLNATTEARSAARTGRNVLHFLYYNKYTSV